MKKPVIYLDTAAATPLDARVLAAMQPYFSDYFYNPSATYNAANEVRKDLQQARTQVAHILGARASEITFTAGGSEANNLAIHGVMRQYPGHNIVVSGIEHESVLMAGRRYECREVSIMPDGRVDLDDLRNKIDEKTVLVSAMYANNEIGTIQPIRKIAQIIKSEISNRLLSQSANPLYFHTDACQAANFLDLHVSGLGVDMMTLGGGKIYGPKQSGILYVKAGIQLHPLVDGGGQEHGLRSGTENVAGSVGFAKALEIAYAMRSDESERLKTLQDYFVELLKTQIPEAIINGSLKQRLPNNIHLTIPNADNERLLILLDQAGIMAAAGSACSASSDEPSHVLTSLGLDNSLARASLRLTMGRDTTKSMIEKTVETLSTLSLS